eukprot:TRINITY_DN5897_c0_g1_i4.p1 TRINITY_DN5897_c0_g1~~TRINITY_DN5897_c0_g1_i4.p1  ORF type:complete len:355 (+),score=37.48 TRINITY_DN5897_c0_g1_i4:48-1112(+)
MARNRLSITFKAIAMALVSSVFFSTPCLLALPQPFHQHSLRKRQKAAILQSDKIGLGLHTKVSSGNHSRKIHRMTANEKHITSKLVDAGKNADWPNVERIYKLYTGQATPVHTAAMVAAYRCARYEEGSAMFARMENCNALMDHAVYTIALKLFGKLRRQDAIDKLWAEDANVVNEVLCAGRINAAAEQGDIDEAVGVIDLMYARRIEVDLGHFSSAINACKHADKPSHSSALFLLEKMLEGGMTPNIVTYCSLAAAHRCAPLENLKHIRAMMAKQQLRADNVFVEIYLTSLFRKHLSAEWATVEEVVRDLKGFSKHCVLEGADVISEAKANRVKLSLLVRKIECALPQLIHDW